MIYSTVLTIWRTIQELFHKTAKSVPEKDLTLKIGAASIGYMLRHNAEVEYMFGEWFFGRKMPESLVLTTNTGPVGSKAEYTNLAELLDLLAASNEFMTEAMRDLPEEKWNEPVETPIGSSTPLEAVARLIYHTGLHAGQISLIQKNATREG